MSVDELKTRRRDKKRNEWEKEKKEKREREAVPLFLYQQAERMHHIMASCRAEASAVNGLFGDDGCDYCVQCTRNTAVNILISLTGRLEFALRNPTANSLVLPAPARMHACISFDAKYT
jgi:hypothetical protein